MATSKTLTPTNETISIPAMTDQPDASVFSNCIDKEADAINALNSQLMNDKIINRETATVHDFIFPNQSANIIAVNGNGG